VKPRAATFFCGAGGADLGLVEAGFDIVVGLDVNEAALETYRAAGGHGVRWYVAERPGLYVVPISEGKTRTRVDFVPGGPVPPELRELLKGLFLLWGSPPCQPWSKAGKRQGAKDRRDGWPGMLAAVAELRPTWVVCENVPGVEQHLDDHIVPALERLGYVVSYRTLNAADYGVPQTRSRVFLVAGPEPLVWPRATHAQRPGLFREAPWISMGEALGLTGDVLTSQSSARAGGRVPVARGTEQPSPCVRAQLGTGFVFVPDAEPQGHKSQSQRIMDPRQPAPTVCGSNRDTGKVRWAAAPPGLIMQATGRWSGRLPQRHPVYTLGRAIRSSHDYHVVAIARREPAPQLRVLGAGTNPHGPGAQDERTRRDITDEPSPTVCAQQIGNRGPWLVQVDAGRIPSKERPKGLHQSAPTITAGRLTLRAVSPSWTIQVDGGRNMAAHPRQERPKGLHEPAQTLGGGGNLMLRLVAAPAEDASSHNSPHRTEILARPSPTVTTCEVKGTRASASSGWTFNGGPDRASDAAWLATGKRRLTVGECAILQGFPDGYPWKGNITAQYEQVGNAVPPPLSRAIAASIRRQLPATRGGGR